MQILILKFKPILLSFCMLFLFISGFGQKTTSTPIYLEKAKLIIDSLDKQFSKHYFNGDSLSIYNMYAKGAKYENLRGTEILLSWGKQIRNSIKNDTRNLIFTTTSLSTDSEFLVELGRYEIKDSKGTLKYDGKYLVVWKQEDGNWKLYRDMGL